MRIQSYISDKLQTLLPVPFKTSKFPGGELNVVIDPTNVKNHVEIMVELHSSDDVMELLMTTDALKRLGAFHIYLYMDYVPYGRQDRVANFGEALSIKIFCDLINSQGYDSVTILDPHSDVTAALLNNCKVVGQERLVYEMLHDTMGNIFKPQLTMLISPDAGANKKTLKVAQKCGFEGVIRADKIRETTTGKITGTEVYCGDLGNQDVIIVDDICDGGYTFIELAKILKTKTTGKIMLYVTHGIFSKGLEVFGGMIDHVFCYRTFLTERPHIVPGTPVQVVPFHFYKIKGEF